MLPYEGNQFAIKFANTRDNKNIHSFVKTLMSMDEFCYKDSGSGSSKQVFMFVSKDGTKLSIGSNLYNVMELSSDKMLGHNYVDLKVGTFQVETLPQRDTVVSFPLKPMMSFFDQKTETRMITTQLQFENGKCSITYITSDQLKGQMIIQYIDERGQWPDFAKDSMELSGTVSEKIHIAEIPMNICKTLYLEKAVYMQLTEEGIEFKRKHDEHFSWVKIVQAKMMIGYDWNVIKKHLLGRQYVYVATPLFTKHMKSCSRFKSNLFLSIILIHDKHNSTAIKQSHLLTTLKPQKVETIYKVFPVAINFTPNQTFDDFQEKSRDKKPINTRTLTWKARDIHSVKQEQQNDGVEKLALNINYTVQQRRQRIWDVVGKNERNRKALQMEAESDQEDKRRLKEEQRERRYMNRRRRRNSDDDDQNEDGQKYEGMEF